MKIMHTLANDTIAQRPKRRYYSPVLKAQIVAECQVSGASVADPYAYLREVMARLPMQRASQVGKLLPHRCEPTKADLYEDSISHWLAHAGQQARSFSVRYRALSLDRACAALRAA